MTENPSAEQPGSDQLPDPDQAWEALSLVNEWIRHAETKAGAVLASAGVGGGVLYNLVKDSKHHSCLISITAFVCGALIVAAGLLAAAALLPRRRVAGQPENFSNLLFYAHVARNYATDEPTYAQVLAALTSDARELTRHIANQIHANSIVAQRKFTYTAWGIAAIVGTLASLALLAIFIGGATN